MGKINEICGTYESWIRLDKFNIDAEISDTVMQINVDTRDFALGWNFEHPKSFLNVTCGLESKSNKGLSKLYNLFTKSEETKEKYAINKQDILNWLNELCEKTGGFEKEWRYLSADVKNCSNWDIKYIRFVRNKKNLDEFIVCNSYYFPIEYKEVIGKLKEGY